MACEAPNTVAANYLDGPRKIVATWKYDGDSHLGFLVQLIKIDSLAGTSTIYTTRRIFKNARKYTFSKIHAGPGQHWRVDVATLCEDCSTTPFVGSPVVIINGAPS